MNYSELPWNDHQLVPGHVLYWPNTKSPALTIVDWSGQLTLQPQVTYLMKVNCGQWMSFAHSGAVSALSMLSVLF